MTTPDDYRTAMAEDAVGRFWAQVEDDMAARGIVMLSTRARRPPSPHPILDAIAARALRDQETA